MPKITVAMSSYNHEKYVGATIKSVLAQSGCDFDFSIVDDGSSDNTVKEIQRFQDPRIHFTAFSKNKGACVALRKAIENGKGKYVAIINSDDYFLPDKLKKQSDFLDANPNIHAVFAYPEIVDVKGNPLDDTQQYYGSLFLQPNRNRSQWLNHFFFKHNALCHPTLMIRRECYEALGYYDPRLSQLPDFEYWIRLLFKYNIHILQEKLIQFRILPDGANVGAPNQAGDNQMHWELLHCLENYLQISSIDEFLTIFPDESSYVVLKDNDLIPFYLAQMTLRHQENLLPVYQLFALETLYTLFKKPSVCIKLESIGYTYAHFLKNSRSNHIFYFPPLRIVTNFEKLVKITSPIWWCRKIYVTVIKLFKRFVC